MRIPFPQRKGVRLLATGLICLAGAAARAAEATPSGDVAEGKELFAREWMANDPRSQGGDGLGPVYNDTSCVACHNLGAPGGAGPVGKNADIITAIPNRGAGGFAAQEPGFFRLAIASLIGADEPTEPRPAAKPRPPHTGELVKLHAGFRTARSVVLHRYGTEAGYEAWRLQMVGLSGFGGLGGEQDRIKTMMRFSGPLANQGRQVQAGEFTVVQSQRNPTALFGAGLIDSISDETLEAAAAVPHPGYPEIKGRVSRLKGGKIGRFGWKAQTPSLDGFVRTACAVELGLESPGHHQGGLPQAADRKATGPDLTDGQCASLVAYVRALPSPAVIEASLPQEAEQLAKGRDAFAGAGCATCHTRKLGAVDGIYSDLLLHDMGQDLGDVGQYSVFDPNSNEPDIIDEDTIASQDATPDTEKKPVLGAARLEWRTPPLWGFRDSGPYMHDGRASTLDEAVALHGGQAATSTSKYFALSHQERLTLQAFLKSLVAPTTIARAGD